MTVTQRSLLRERLTNLIADCRNACAAANASVESTTGKTALLILLAVIYTAAYLAHPALPGNISDAPLGWWGWSDQSFYLKCAASLSHLRLPPAVYVYPIGYSVLGAVFYRWLPVHSFFFPNLLLVLGLVSLFYRVARRFITPLETILFLAAFAVCYHRTVADCLVVPWNTIPTACAAYGIIMLLSVKADVRERDIIIAAGCVAATYLVRTADAACLIPIVALAIPRLRTWKSRVISGALAASIVIAAVCGVLALNHAVFGSFRTPYEKTAQQFGFGGYSFLRKTYWLVITGMPVFKEQDAALLSHYWWLVLALPGAVVYVWQYRLRAVALLISFGATFSLYFSYNGALWPHNLYRFLLIHYLFWTLPFVALLVYWATTRFVSRRRLLWSALALVATVVAIAPLTLEPAAGKLAVRYEPDAVEVADATGAPLDWLEINRALRNNDLVGTAFPLTPVRDFIILLYGNGARVLLSKHAGEAPVRIATDLGGATPLEVRGGSLHWRYRWPPAFVLHALSYACWRPVIHLDGKTAERDVTGPAGRADGHADETISILLRRALLRRITDWSVATDVPEREWRTDSTVEGLWPIKTEVSNVNGNYSSIRLCFADFGDFEHARIFRLQGRDSGGRLILRTTVMKSGGDREPSDE